MSYQKIEFLYTEDVDFGDIGDIGGNDGSILKTICQLGGAKNDDAADTEADDDKNDASNDDGGGSTSNGRTCNERITKVSLYYISHKCTWIQELKLDYCANGDLGELKPLGNLLQLRLLSCKACKGLSGDLRDLSRLSLLEDLDLSLSGITGDIGSLISVIRLKHLDLSRTLVDGNVWKLSGLRLEKLLLEGTQVSPQHLRNFRLANPQLLKAEIEEAQESDSDEEGE